jgi:hypothetical protein
MSSSFVTRLSSACSLSARATKILLQQGQVDWQAGSISMLNTHALCPLSSMWKKALDNKFAQIFIHIHVWPVGPIMLLSSTMSVCYERCVLCVMALAIFWPLRPKTVYVYLI